MIQRFQTAPKQPEHEQPDYWNQAQPYGSEEAY